MAGSESRSARSAGGTTDRIRITRSRSWLQHPRLRCRRKVASRREDRVATGAGDTVHGSVVVVSAPESEARNGYSEGPRASSEGRSGHLSGPPDVLPGPDRI